MRSVSMAYPIEDACDHCWLKQEHEAVRSHGNRATVRPRRRATIVARTSDGSCQRLRTSGAALAMRGGTPWRPAAPGQYHP